MARGVRIFISDEYSSMVSTWRDYVHLKRLSRGTFSVEMYRRGADGTSHEYSSNPFHTAAEFIAALREAESESSYESFDAKSVDSMVDAAASLNGRLAAGARALLAQCPWGEDDEDDEDTETRMLSKVRLD